MPIAALAKSLITKIAETLKKMLPGEEDVKAALASIGERATALSAEIDQDKPLTPEKFAELDALMFDLSDACIAAYVDPETGEIRPEVEAARKQPEPETMDGPALEKHVEAALAKAAGTGGTVVKRFAALKRLQKALTAAVSVPQIESAESVSVPMDPQSNAIPTQSANPSAPDAATAMGGNVPAAKADTTKAAPVRSPWPMDMANEVAKIEKAKREGARK